MVIFFDISKLSYNFNATKLNKMETNNKTHFKKLFNPNYLGSWDFVKGEDANGKPIYKEAIVTISSVKKEIIELQGQKREEVLVRFDKVAKPLILKPENSKLISKSLGTPFYENWIGKQITLHVIPVVAFKETTDAVRVKYIKP